MHWYGGKCKKCNWLQNFRFFRTLSSIGRFSTTWRQVHHAGQNTLQIKSATRGECTFSSTVSPALFKAELAVEGRPPKSPSRISELSTMSTVWNKRLTEREREKRGSWKKTTPSSTSYVTFVSSLSIFLSCSLELTFLNVEKSLWISAWSIGHVSSCVIKRTIKIHTQNYDFWKRDNSNVPLLFLHTFVSHLSCAGAERQNMAPSHTSMETWAKQGKKPSRPFLVFTWSEIPGLGELILLLVLVALCSLDLIKFIC